MAVLQMTWQPSSLNQKRKSGPPLGLQNLGNSCYLNSVLQCLTYTPPLANFCLKFQHSSSCDLAGLEKKRDCPFCILERRIVRSLSVDLTLDAPLKIKNCLKIFAEHFKNGRQEDAHEFLRYVIDACHNKCLKLKNLQLQRRKDGNGGETGNGNTIVKEIFGGALQSQVKCLSCGAESNKVDEMMDISLDIFHSGTLKDALQRFFQPEILDGNNKYKCDNCKKLVAARKQLSILQAPNVLVIQLKRFGGIFGGKIDKPIAFEEVLVLSSYMCKGSQDMHPEYRLSGTIVHSGFSPDSGHYYAYIKDAMGRWYCCNDSFVTLSTLQEVLSEKVYILFFTRSKQRQPLVKTDLLANGSKCHQSNGSDASKILVSGQSEKVVNVKHVSDQNPETNNSVVPKVNKVPSAPTRKLSISGNSDTRKSSANGGIKIVVHRKEYKTCNPRASIDTENNRQNGQMSTYKNGVSKVRPDDAFDTSKNEAPFTIANGNCKIQNVNGGSLEGSHCEDSVRKDDMAVGRTPIDTIANGNCKFQNVNGSYLEGGHREDGVWKDNIAVGRTPSDIIANGHCKIQNANGGSLEGRHHEDRISKDNMAVGRTPGNEGLSNGDVKSYSDYSGLKRKSQDKDPCLLLAKDAQSRTEVEEFKKVIEKEASLALSSCGWSDEVYKFMHSRKKLCVGGAEYAASNIKEMKRLLIKDAKSTFISKIPESLKGRLIEHLILFSKERQSST